MLTPVAAPHRTQWPSKDWLTETFPGGLEALARAVAACDFLGAGALPAAAAVCGRLLPGAEAAAEEEAKEAFLGVMERTSFGPALWAVVPLETVGRLAGSDGQDEQGDEHVLAVAGMARAELGRRILGLPDLELAMLRAHAAAPVAGLAQAELRRRYPQLAPMTNESVRAAIKAIKEENGGNECDFLHSPVATAKYGPVPLWEVQGVTDFSELWRSRDRLVMLGENPETRAAHARAHACMAGAAFVLRAPPAFTSQRRRGKHTCAVCSHSCRVHLLQTTPLPLLSSITF